MKFLLSLFLSAMIVSSCQKGVDDVQGGSLPAATYMNVSYGNDTLQRMDVYLPAGRTKDSTKVIVLIHGGAWMEGDKRDFESFIPVFRQKLPEYAIINVNYRLASQAANHFPTQENDIKAAINQIYSKRDEYQISDKFVLMGASAGAHLALLQSYKYTSPVKVQAVVSLFGPTDLAAMYHSQTNPFYQWALSILIGGTPTSNQDAYNQSSPIFFASAQSPPTILLHGGNDPLVSIDQSISLHNKLQSSGVTTQLVTYPNEGHGWVGTNMDDSFNKIAAFIRANVK